MQLVGEVAVELATVNGPLAGTGYQADAGNGFLATANRLTTNGQCGAGSLLSEDSEV